MIVRTMRRLLHDRTGGTAVEYGLIVGLIVIVMVAAFVEVADTTTTMWGNVNTKIEHARTGG